jgi:hypothetical protein
VEEGASHEAAPSFAYGLAESRLEGPGLMPTMYRIRPDGTDLHALYASSDVVPRFIDWGPAAGN